MPEVQTIRLDEQLGLLLSHPLRVEIMVVLIEGRAAPAEITKLLGAKLSDVSYHVKQLLKMEFIELVDVEPRRGQNAHVYRAVLRPIWSNEEWGKLSQEERERYVAWTIQLSLRDVVMAIGCGAFQARPDAHTSRAPLLVDEQGWREINALLDNTLKASFKVEEESLERLSESGEKGIVVRSVMLCHELPAPEARPKRRSRA